MEKICIFDIMIANKVKIMAEERPIIEFLEQFIKEDLQVNGKNEGECIFCNVELDRGQPHTPICLYAQAVKLLVGKIGLRI